MKTMKAIVVEAPGGPDVLQIKEVPRPKARPGWVLVAVEAFGLNRAELFTRCGDSGPAVVFPRIIGIECVGRVVEAHNGPLAVGQKVAAMMGGMGRAFDGSYAECVLLPEACVLPIDTDLPWETFGALPEMFQTASGSLRLALGVAAGRTLLIRGGTSSVGLAAAALARELGLTVIATTRRKERSVALHENGALHVLVDETGRLNDSLRAIFPEGVDFVLELVGTATLNDSLAMLRHPGGICCMTGILAGEWQLNERIGLWVSAWCACLRCSNNDTLVVHYSAGRAVCCCRPHCSGPFCRAAGASIRNRFAQVARRLARPGAYLVGSRRCLLTDGGGINPRSDSHPRPGPPAG